MGTCTAAWGRQQLVCCNRCRPGWPRQQRWLVLLLALQADSFLTYLADTAAAAVLQIGCNGSRCRHAGKGLPP